MYKQTQISVGILGDEVVDPIKELTHINKEGGSFQDSYNRYCTILTLSSSQVTAVKKRPFQKIAQFKRNFLGVLGDANFPKL
jgi:hypothetical protein